MDDDSKMELINAFENLVSTYEEAIRSNTSALNKVNARLEKLRVTYYTKKCILCKNTRSDWRHKEECDGTCDDIPNLTYGHHPFQE